MKNILIVLCLFSYQVKTEQISYKKEQCEIHTDALLGHILFRGLAKDVKAAIKHTKKAGDKGHLASQITLWSVYSAGTAVPKDDKKAFYWAKKVAEQGLPLFQNFVGREYEKGTGAVPRDYERAFYWYKKAGNQDAIKEILEKVKANN